MQHYVVKRARSEKKRTVTVVCGGCGNGSKHIPVAEAYRIRVPVGWGGVFFDPRMKTPTGGRFGYPGDLTVRRFMRTEIKFGCVSCALKFTVVERPRDAAFAERCKRR